MFHHEADVGWKGCTREDNTEASSDEGLQLQCEQLNQWWKFVLFYLFFFFFVFTLGFSDNSLLSMVLYSSHRITSQ